MPLPTLESVPNPLQWGYDAALDDLLLRLIRGPDRQLDIASAPKEPNKVQTEQTAEDFLPEFGQVFSRNDFTGGEGLAFAFRPGLTDRDSTRYWDSKGIDISIAKPGTLGGIKLLHATAQVWSSASTNLHACRLTDGTIIWAEGSTTYSVSDISAGSPSRTNQDPFSGGTQDVRGLAALGNTAFAACGSDGIGKRSGAGTWSNLSTNACHGIWAAKSRLIADNGAGLVQVVDPGTGAVTTLITLDAADSVTAVTDAGAAILVATNDGSIYALVDNQGVLEVVSQTRLTASDVVTAMAWASGVLFLGTKDGTIGRLWRAFLGDNATDFTLANAQLYKELTNIPIGAVATRDRIYIAARADSAEVELWRYQLATGSLSRDLVVAAASAGSPVAVLFAKERLVLTVGGNGFYRELLTYVPEGWLISPMADFFSPLVKTWIGIRAQAQDLAVDAGAVSLSMATDPDALLDEASLLWQPVGVLGTGSDVNQELLLPAILGRYGAVQIRLTTENTAVTPTYLSFALRSFSDGDEIILRLPVNVSDRIERPGRRPVNAKNWGHEVYSALLGYDGKHVDLQVYRPPLIVRGAVEKVETPVLDRGTRGSATMLCWVQVRGKVVGESEASGGGSGTLGVFPAGTLMAGGDIG